MSQLSTSLGCNCARGIQCLSLRLLFQRLLAGLTPLSWSGFQELWRFPVRSVTQSENLASDLGCCLLLTHREVSKCGLGNDWCQPSPAQPNKVNNYGDVGHDMCSFSPTDRLMFEASQSYVLRTCLKIKKKKRQMDICNSLQDAEWEPDALCSSDSLSSQLLPEWQEDNMRMRKVQVLLCAGEKTGMGGPQPSLSSLASWGLWEGLLPGTSPSSYPWQTSCHFCGHLSPQARKGVTHTSSRTQENVTRYNAKCTLMVPGHTVPRAFCEPPREGEPVQISANKHHRRLEALWLFCIVFKSKNLYTVWQVHLIFLNDVFIIPSLN